MIVTLYENISTLKDERCPVASVRAADVVEIAPVRKPRDLNYQSSRSHAAPEELRLHRDEETGETWLEEFEVRMVDGAVYLCRFIFPREAGSQRRALIAAINGDAQRKEQQEQLQQLSSATLQMADAITLLSQRVHQYPRHVPVSPPMTEGRDGEEVLREIAQKNGQEVPEPEPRRRTAPKMDRLVGRGRRD